MYPKKLLLAVLTILGSSNIWSVECLRTNRTEIEGTLTEAVNLESKKDNQSQNQSQISPQDSSKLLRQYPADLPEYPTEKPLISPQPAIVTIDQYDNRYPDGSYEFRYELSDETVRYERGYIIHYQHKNILVVRGHYSYRLPDNRYLTVFYRADQNGFSQDKPIISWNRPHLHRSANAELQGKPAWEIDQDSGIQNSATKD